METAPEYIQTRHGWVAAFRCGDAPTLFVNGGPGMACSPGVSEDLSVPMTFYDQTGCGLSDDDAGDRTLAHHVEELEDLADGLGFGRFALIGVSWGAAVALEYAHRHPDRVSKLVLGSPFISASDWNADQRANVGGMLRVLADFIGSGIRGDGFDEAYAGYLMAHSTMGPAEAVKCIREMSSEAYSEMWGEAELKCTGTLRDTELTGCLSELPMETLVYCGDRDEIRVGTACGYARAAPRGRLFVAPGSGHGVNFDCPRLLGAVLRAFLQE